MRNLRSTPLYQEAEALYAALRRAGTGQISAGTEINVSPDGQFAVFSGVIPETLSGSQHSRVCSVELSSGDMRVLSFGPNMDRLPKISPDGAQIAFLSDRHRLGDFQLYLLDRLNGGARPAARVSGWVEYLHWSPDGRRILLGVAGHGADVSGAQGATKSAGLSEDTSCWMPTVDTGDAAYRWRRAWIYELSTGHVRPIGSEGSNVWEAVWCGNDALAAVVSPGAGEGSWYSARLTIINVESGRSHEIFVPGDQLGWPACSPSGAHVCVVEAFSSDRWVVAGDLRLIDLESGNVRRLDTQGIDVTYTEWRSDRHLLLAGQRRFETVVGWYDLETSAFTEVWSSNELTTGGFYAAVSGFGAGGDCVLIAEAFARAPEIGAIRAGRYRTVRSLDPGHAGIGEAVQSVSQVSWQAPDGLEIQGWLLLPRGTGPHPLIMNIHGGPVGQWRPQWLGRGASTLMLLRRGYAIFYPNPRGSSGRGQEFARGVLGDMGGADADDLLSGVDHLVRLGIADPKRLGVTGGSYGGFMTCWLITRDSRFGAAVAVAPITHYVSGRLLSNAAHFYDAFLGDTWRNPGGRHFQRSPVMRAHRVKTPTLTICGMLDRITPAAEGVQFHNALRAHGVESTLLLYPEEGHGVRRLPAVVDYAARVVEWFQQHLQTG